MGSQVTLVGLDFGSTTSSAVVADASLVQRAATGRVEIGEIRERYRSEFAFTPFDGGAIDLPRVCALLDGWLAAAGVREGEVFGGGAIVTGLAARRRNAGELARAVRERAFGAVMAVAEDPCLEAWMAFMGSAAAVSRAHPETPILNIDIGGGTTNLAIGIAGEVRCTGCLAVGARHVAVTPGTSRIAALSELGRDLLKHLGLRKGPGDALLPAEIEAIVDLQVGLIEAAVDGRAGALEAPIARRHVEVPLAVPPELAGAALTFSGGVGELVYAGLDGRALPPPGHYGDLGIELGRRVLASPRLSSTVRVPPGVGRATAYGLLRHATQLSGSTLFLPHPEILPLEDLPILGRIAPGSSPDDIARAVDLVRRSGRGGCVEVTLGAPGAAAVRDLGQRIAAALRARPFPEQLPFVLLLRENAAKALGGYVTGWGSARAEILVIDEVDARGAHFVQIGRLHEQVLPVSFHGMS